VASRTRRSASAANAAPSQGVRVAAPRSSLGALERARIEADARAKMDAKKFPTGACSSACSPWWRSPARDGRGCTPPHEETKPQPPHLVQVKPREGRRMKAPPSSPRQN